MSDAEWFIAERLSPGYAVTSDGSPDLSDLAGELQDAAHSALLDDPLGPAAVRVTIERLDR